MDALNEAKLTGIQRNRDPTNPAQASHASLLARLHLSKSNMLDVRKQAPVIASNRSDDQLLRTGELRKVRFRDHVERLACVITAVSCVADVVPQRSGDHDSTVILGKSQRARECIEQVARKAG